MFCIHSLQYFSHGSHFSNSTDIFLTQFLKFLACKNVTNQISEVAKKLNLLECGGSDYHGDIKPNINLGYGYENTPIKVPYKFLNDMKEKHGQL